jgi:hypothetical protein
MSDMAKKMVDMAINSFNQDREFFPITSVCSDDLIHVFENDARAKKAVKNMDADVMMHLASEMGDDYCEQLFWDSLRIIFESKFIKSTEVKNDVE